MSVFLADVSSLPRIAPLKKGSEFPDWAPAELVSRFRKRDGNYVEKLPSKLPEGKFFMFLPEAYGTALLGLLLTAPEMKSVWTAIGKRRRVPPTGSALRGSDVSAFISACEIALVQWAMTPKRTRAEHRAFYRRLADQIDALSGLIRETGESSFLRLTSFLDPKWTEGLADTLGVEEGDEFARFWINDRLPDVLEVLDRIRARAIAESRSTTVIAQPRGENANANHFARFLSAYFLKSYRQPLHDHVASVTSVVFGIAIDATKVRKLVANGDNSRSLTPEETKRHLLDLIPALKFKNVR